MSAPSCPHVPPLPGRSGLFETGMYEYDNNYVTLKRPSRRSSPGSGTAVTGIEVRIADPWNAREFGAALEDALGYPYRMRRLAGAELLAVLARSSSRSSPWRRGVPDRARGGVQHRGHADDGGDATRRGRSASCEPWGCRRGAIRRIFLAQGIVIGVVGTGDRGGARLRRRDRGGPRRADPARSAIYFIDHLPVPHAGARRGARSCWRAW